jgi:biotin carboxyl carrier protein
VTEWLRDGSALRVEARALGQGRFEVRVGESVHAVEAQRLPDGRVAFVLDGRNHEAAAAALPGGSSQVRVDGRTWELAPFRGARAGAARDGSGVVEAPMTGTVLAIHVAPGQEVAAGDTVALLSAMKMEHRLAAEIDGVVAEVGAGEGQTVEQGTVLVRIAPRG